MQEPDVLCIMHVVIRVNVARPHVKRVHVGARRPLRRKLGNAYPRRECKLLQRLEVCKRRRAPAAHDNKRRRQHRNRTPRGRLKDLSENK